MSRRNLFKQAGLAVPPQPLRGDGRAGCRARGAQSPATASAPAGSSETLTAAEADMLEAIVARLIPTDETGPGAAGGTSRDYIDRALVGPLRASRSAYAGLAALDAYSRTAGRASPRLAAKDQDAVLSDLEKNVATGFKPNSSAFFNLVRTHTIQGTFCDPYYGGNANFVGWDLIGYPGIRLTVGADEQRMSARAKTIRGSAYDDAMFSMKGGSHGHRP